MKRRDRIELREQVQFDTAKDVIRPESRQLLREVARILAEHPELKRVRVEGHTDGVGAAAKNVRLSERRARAVVRWLVEQGGVAPSRLEAKGFGPARPVDTNGTAEGRARNRRVELTVIESSPM